MSRPFLLASAIIRASSTLLVGLLLFCANSTAQQINASVHVTVKGQPVITASQLNKDYGTSQHALDRVKELAYKLAPNQRVPIAIWLTTADGRKRDITADPKTKLLVQFPNVARATGDGYLIVQKASEWPEGFSDAAPVNLAIGYEGADANGGKIFAYDIAHMRAVASP